jgi:hypothetical protein
MRLQRVFALIGLALIAGFVQDSPLPPGTAVRMDMALYESAPVGLLEAWISDWVVSDADREIAKSIIDNWAREEGRFDLRTFAQLRVAEARLAEFARRPGGWRNDPAAVDLYVSTVRDRSRANERRRSREHALAIQLATSLHRPDGDEIWILGRLSAWRGSHLPCLVTGADFDFGVALLAGSGEIPAGRSRKVLREYWVSMKPLWDAKLAARDVQLLSSSELAQGTGAVADFHAANRKFLDACRSIVVENLAWCSRWDFETNPNASCEALAAERGRLRSACLSAPPPCVPVDHDCQDESPIAQMSWQLRQMAEDVLEIAWLGSLEMAYRRGTQGPSGLGDDVPKIWESREQLLNQLFTVYEMVAAADS